MNQMNGVMWGKMMTNGDKFKSLFGISASELWCMNGGAFTNWLNEDFVEGKNPCSECQEFNCDGCEYEYRYR